MDIRTPHLWSEAHPSWEIISEKEGDLQGKCIVLGVTASAAIYRSIDLARTLMRIGAIVRVAMTPESTKLVSPTLFEWATGLPVVDSMTGAVEHVSLAKLCEALVVAPASLETLSQIAGYSAKTVVSAMAQEMLGLGKKVLVVPAMHQGMWRRSKKLVEDLRRQGVHVMNPVVEGDRAKYPPTELVAWWVEAVIARGEDYTTRKILVTAGPTREYIDPVRVVTNPSTGLMGLSLALEAKWRGAEVVLVHGPLSTRLPSEWRNYLDSVHRVTTTSEMMEKVLEVLENNSIDIALYAAAVADYKPEQKNLEKIPSRQGSITIELVPTPKIIARAVKTSPQTLHIGFAAETAKTTKELLEKAKKKLQEYNLYMVVANNVSEEGAGFATETNHVYIVRRRGEPIEIPKMHKRLVARRILDILSVIND